MTLTPDEVFDRLPNVGDRVIYTTKTARHGRGLELEMRKGSVLAVWSNGWDGPHVSTTTGCFIPALGDTWTAWEDGCDQTLDPLSGGCSGRAASTG